MRRTLVLLLATLALPIAAGVANANIGLLETINITGPNTGAVSFVGTIPANYDTLVLYWAAGSQASGADTLNCFVNGQTSNTVTVGSIPGASGFPDLNTGHYAFPAEVNGQRIFTIECVTGSTAAYTTGSWFKLENQ